jgi:hypothetical protein
MRMLPFRIAAVLLALTPLALVPGACTTEDGTTSSCVADVDQSGNRSGGSSAIEDGCNPFPACVVDGKAVDARQCCVDADGNAFTGRQLDECLYGFGALGSINVSSSTTTSGGGAGGDGEGGAGGAGNM